MVISAYGKGHEASVCYSWLIQSLGDGALLALQKIWERDLNLIFDDEEWNRVLKNVKTASRDAKIRLIQFKIVHCFYWTPYRLYRLGLKDTPYCWWCKTEDGDLTHALWSCTKIQDFWKKVHEHICTVLDTHISLCPQLFILGGWTDNEIRDKHIMYWV